MEKRLLPTALYCRLSREDGDRMESDSIGNQRKLLVLERADMSGLFIPARGTAL